MLQTDYTHGEKCTVNTSCTQKKVLFKFKKAFFKLDFYSIRSENTLGTDINLFDFNKSRF